MKSTSQHFFVKILMNRILFLIYFCVDIRDAFSEYGPVKSVHVNLDLQTGFCKGYALIEYNEKSEAQDAINALHGTELLGKSVKVDWAFVGGGGDSSMGVEGVPRKKTKRR